MRRLIRGLLGLAALVLAAATAQAGGSRIHLAALDLKGRPLPGLRFMYALVKSRPTGQAGATELELPADHTAGRQIKIALVPSPQAEDWFLVTPQVNIPAGAITTTLFLMRRRTFRQLAAETRDASHPPTLDPADPAWVDRQRTLLEAAARRGLRPDQLESAILSFAETQNIKDRAIAAYLKGQFSQAEDLLSQALAKKVADFVETQRYLGATLYQQKKYGFAEEAFRKGLEFRNDDAELLSGLGRSLRALSKGAEAESHLRRALVLSLKAESCSGPASTETAQAREEYRSLLQDLGRSIPEIQATIEALEATSRDDCPTPQEVR